MSVHFRGKLTTETPPAGCALFRHLTFFILSPHSAHGISSTVVMRQVEGGAGCTTVNCSTYKNHVIELHKRGDRPVSLSRLVGPIRQRRRNHVASHAAHQCHARTRSILSGRPSLQCERRQHASRRRCDQHNCDECNRRESCSGEFDYRLERELSERGNLVDLVGYGSGVSCYWYGSGSQRDESGANGTFAPSCARARPPVGFKLRWGFAPFSTADQSPEKKSRKSDEMFCQVLSFQSVREFFSVDLAFLSL